VDVATVQHLRRAKDLIDRRYADPLDLEVLAREAGFSRFHFARSFSAAFGETPRSYLTRRRVERAKDLLRGANLTVTEVCMLVGFASLGSFSARFSEIVGMPPSEFRRQQVERGGHPPVPGCYLLAWARPDLPNRTRGEATSGGAPLPSAADTDPADTDEEHR
jgi:AraC-like DNA-binding protein